MEAALFVLMLLWYRESPGSTATAGQGIGTGLLITKIRIEFWGAPDYKL